MRKITSVVVALLATLGIAVFQTASPAMAHHSYRTGSCYPDGYGSGNTAVFKVTGWQNSNGTWTFHYSIRGGYKVKAFAPDPRYYWYGMKNGYGWSNYRYSETYATLGGVRYQAQHTGIWNKYSSGVYNGRVSCSTFLYATGA